jgi:hypothetical protein
MRLEKQNYNFLPNGWYFEINYRAGQNYNDKVSLYTNSLVSVAWTDDYGLKKIQILKGMEHEREFIENLFAQKLAHDSYVREQRDIEWRAESAARDQERLSQVLRDFDKINRT